MGPAFFSFLYFTALPTFDPLPYRPLEAVVYVTSALKQPDEIDHTWSPFYSRGKEKIYNLTNTTQLVSGLGFENKFFRPENKLLTNTLYSLLSWQGFHRIVYYFSLWTKKLS